MSFVEGHEIFCIFAVTLNTNIMEFFIEKVVTENVLVKYTAYVEADTLDEAIQKAADDSNEIDWNEDHNELLDTTTRSITEKPLE